MWRLSFFVAPERDDTRKIPLGSWCISLSLLETSPPTYINSHLVMSKAKGPLSPTHGPSSLMPTSSNSLRKPENPAIYIKLVGELEAAQNCFNQGKIVVALIGSLAGANFQYEWVENSIFSMNLVDMLSLQEQPLYFC